MDYQDAPDVITRVVIREKQEIITRRRCDDRGRDWSDAATSQGMLAVSRS